MSFTVFQVDESELLSPFAHERERIAAAGGELVRGDCTSEDEIIERAGGADVLWLNWKPGLTRRVFEALPACRLAIRWGVGYDQIDVDAATDLGVAVANAPAWATADVAEHALALLLACTRRIVEQHERMRRGEWPGARLGTIHRLGGRTLGIVGVGRIGSTMARLALAHGMHVLGHDSLRTDEELATLGVEPVPLAALAERSDAVSVHVPLTDGTRGLIDGAFLARMRPGSVLVTTSRGPVIDEDALVAALVAGTPAAAGLDVYREEPLPADSPLRSLPNVVMTPHVAAFSDESWQDLRDEMCRNTVEFVTTGWTEAIVNPAVRERLRRPQ